MSILTRKNIVNKFSKMSMGVTGGVGTLSEIMHREVLSIEFNEPVALAARKMVKEHFGGIIVTQDGKVVGIITERDMVRKVLAKEQDIAKLKVEDIMSQPLITVDSSTRIDVASRLMSKNGIRRLVIVEHGRLVGIVTITDIANYVAKSKGRLRSGPSGSTSTPHQEHIDEVSGTNEELKLLAYEMTSIAVGHVRRRQVILGAFASFLATWAVVALLMTSEWELDLQQGTFYTVLGIALGSNGSEARDLGFMLHILSGTLMGTLSVLLATTFAQMRMSNMRRSIDLGLLTGLGGWLLVFLPGTFFIVQPTMHRIALAVGQPEGAAVLAGQVIQMGFAVAVSALTYHLVYGFLFGLLMSLLVQFFNKISIRD